MKTALRWTSTIRWLVRLSVSLVRFSQSARLQRRNSQRDFTENTYTLAADATDTADAVAVDATEKVDATVVMVSAAAETTTTKVGAVVDTKAVAAAINSCQTIPK